MRGKLPKRVLQECYKHRHPDAELSEEEKKIVCKDIMDKDSSVFLVKKEIYKDGEDQVDSLTIRFEL